MHYRAALMFVAAASVAFAAAPKYPSTRVDQVTDVLHGKPVADPYRWLEDQESPAVRAWIDEQTGLTKSVLQALPGRERISTRLTEMRRIDTAMRPFVFGDRYFYARRTASQNLQDVYMRRGANGADELLLDVNGMSADRSKTANVIGATADGKLLVYAIRSNGEDEVVLKLMDVDTKRVLEDDFPKARYGGIVFRRGNGASITPLL